jgi:hypothetical protein
MTQFATESGDSHPQLRQNGSDNDGGAIGGILADEPGLGKTLSVMALVIAGRKESRGLPTLIASPTPAIAAQWFGEVERSTEGLKVMHYRDSRMLNDEMRPQHSSPSLQRPTLCSLTSALFKKNIAS